MKKNLNRRMAAALAAVMLAGSLTACGNSSDSAKTTTAQTTAAGSDTQDPAAGGEKTAEGETTLGIAPLAERTTLSIGFFAGSAHSMPWYVDRKSVV